MNILNEANLIIHGEREESYGPVRESNERTAMMWTAILGFPVKAEQVPLCMIALKISRECHKPKRDNLVDIAGYADIKDQLESEIDLPVKSPGEYLKMDRERYERMLKTGKPA